MLVERLRELDRVGVLQRQDVDLALAGLRDVEPLDELEDAQVRALGRDDDEELVRSSATIFVTWRSPPPTPPPPFSAAFAAARRRP